MRKTRIFAWIAALALLIPAAATAQTVIAGPAETIVTDDGGAFSVKKTVTVFDDGGGVFRYQYQLESLSGDPVCAFKLNIPDTLISTASFVPATGVEPVTIDLGPTETTFTFGPSGDPFNCLSTFGVPFVGATSALLEITSAFGPGNVGDTITVSLNSFQGFDEPGLCLGPQDAPIACDLEVTKEGCVQQPASPPGDDCEGKLISFDFEYTGLGCDATSHLQNPKKVACYGGAAGASPVDIRVFKKEHKKRKHKKHRRKAVFGNFEGVALGDINTVQASHGGRSKFPSSTYIKIRDENGTVEKVRFHTSCSQAFAVGNQFGSIKITSITSTLGGTVTGDPDPPEEEECVQEIDHAAAPHCLGKVQNLVIRYTGGVCADTLTSQSANKHGCFEFSSPTGDPVQIILSNGASAPPSTDVYVDGPVAVGGFVTVDPSILGQTQLSSTTGYWIKNLVTGEIIQDGFFHTSCSQPLNLGDQYGALQIFSMDTTQGGAVSLGGTVDYTYTVTNPNAVQVDNVSVEDDKLGTIASGVSIPAGGSVTYETSALIFEDTTNIVTVNGDVGGAVCTEGADSVTISVVEPPDPADVCTSKIKALLLKYTGPAIAGAVTVEIEGKAFPTEPAVHAFPGGLNPGDILSLASENGFSIDALAHYQTDLGSQTTITINGNAEVIHTSCSTPVVKNAPAPLNNPKGAPSSNWLVLDFTQKNN